VAQLFEHVFQTVLFSFSRHAVQLASSFDRHAVEIHSGAPLGLFEAVPPLHHRHPKLVWIDEVNGNDEDDKVD
jgi:hypothetical protein